MSNGWVIDQPQTLISLPQPVDPTSGRIRLGSVWGVQGSRKRRRREIVAAADGECINVYSIKSPCLITTHALSPQTTVTSAPTCVYRHATEHRPALRFTYATARSDFGDSLKELLCFQEDLAAPTSLKGGANPTPIKWTRDVSAIDAAIVHIEPFPAVHAIDGLESHDVLLIFANGDLSIVSENLQEEKAYYNNRALRVGNNADNDLISAPCLEFVSVHTAASASRGLLRGRPDLVAGLDKASAVLLLVMSYKGVEHAQQDKYLIQVVSTTSNFAQHSLRKPQELLMSWHLPSTRTETDAHRPIPCRPHFAFDPASSLLYQFNHGVVSVCNLSSTTPNIVSRFHTAQLDNGYLLPISNSTIMVSSNGQSALYDSRYGSLQAVQMIESTVTESASRKRKQETYSTGALFIPFCSMLTGSGIVVGLIGHDLVSLGVSVRSRGRKRHLQSRLISSLGKVCPTSAAVNLFSDTLPNLSHSPTPSITASFDEPWREMISKLDELPAEQKGQTFDNIFTEVLRSCDNRLDDTIGFPGRDIALNAIGIIFNWSRRNKSEASFRLSRSSCIQATFIPPVAFEWLTRSGHLTAQNIRRALCLHRTPANDPSVAVSEIDVVIAVAEADPTLHLLALLMTSRKLGLPGCVESFKILMQSFDSPQSSEANGLVDLNRARVKKRTIEGLDEELLVEEHAAAHELQVANSILEDGFDARGAALKSCLERLGTCYSLREVVQALRCQLSQRETMMLVDILRIELEQAGWTSRRLDFHPFSDATESQNEAISVICKLLNCALDAMGTVGWLAERQSREADEVSSLISILRAETSAALEGVQESTFFCGFLKDFVRFEDALVDSPKNTGRAVNTSAMSQSRLGMLPFGVKGAQRISSSKVGAGGELQKRSARRIGMELSQRVGKYRFEMIRV